MIMCIFVSGEYGSVVSGQLNIVRTDVMSGSQSVTIKILTGELSCQPIITTYWSCPCKAIVTYVCRIFSHSSTYLTFFVIALVAGIPDGSKRDEVVKFLEAATLMSGVQHENILPVLRVSVEDNYVPLVMYPMVEHGDMFNIIKLASDQEQSILSVSFSFHIEVVTY